MKATFRLVSRGHEFTLYDDKGNVIGQGYSAGSRRDAEMSARELRQSVTVDAQCTEVPPTHDHGGES